MAGSSSGKWVSRAAATGGGRTYRGQVPVNWYAALILIVVLGLGSVVFARYEYQNPSSPSTVPPTVGTTWYAGYDVNVCGRQLAPLASNAGASTSAKAFFTTGNGVITVAPKVEAQAGTNATLGRFVASYPGMGLSATQLRVPTGTKPVTYRNGDRCPAGTPDAGKPGKVLVAYWPSAFASKAKARYVSGDPSSLRFSANQLISIGFVPSGTALAKPGGAVVTALLEAQSSTSTTTPAAATTTVPATVPPTTAPATTAPSSAPSTTTSHPTTTTKPK